MKPLTINSSQEIDFEASIKSCIRKLFILLPHCGKRYVNANRKWPLRRAADLAHKRQYRTDSCKKVRAHAKILSFTLGHYFPTILGVSQLRAEAYWTSYVLLYFSCGDPKAFCQLTVHRKILRYLFHSSSSSPASRSSFLVSAKWLAVWGGAGKRTRDWKGLAGSPSNLFSPTRFAFAFLIFSPYPLCSSYILPIVQHTTTVELGFWMYFFFFPIPVGIRTRNFDHNVR